MNQEKTVRNRWLYRALRIVAAIMTAMMGLALTIATIATLLGDVEVLNDMIDLDTEIETLNMAAEICLVTANILALVTFGLLFQSINRFLNYAERGELFQDSAEKALIGMGKAMILLYFVFLSYDIILPMLAVPQDIFENSIDFITSLIDLNVLTLLLGIVLIALAGALREGRAVQEEYKQII